jgi:1-acyl-sn-glycerol-3-phosphate acyltransferase
MKELIYRWGTRILQVIIQPLFRLKVTGWSQIPDGDGCLLVARHRSYWDIPLLVAALGPHRRIYFVARRTLKRNWLLRPFIRGFAIAIDREHFRIQDYRQILQALQAKRIVGIFPEGTTRSVGRIHNGVIRFAQRIKRPILPVKIAVEGPYPPRYPFGFPRVEIRIGHAFQLQDLESELDGTESRLGRYAQLSRVLMNRIDQIGSTEPSSVTA